MIRSLKAQLTTTGWQTYGMITLILFLAIPYVLLLRPNDGTNAATGMFMGMTLAMVLFVGFLQSMLLSPVLLRMALGFGATRKGWMLAGIVIRVAGNILLVLIYFFAVLPLSAYAFGEPSPLGPAYLPLVLSVTLLASFAGDLVGTIGARFGGKWMVLSILAAVVAIILTIVFIALQLENITSALNLLARPWLPLALVALCIPVQLAEWPLMRNIAAG